LDNKRILRIIDANLNRSREGLRVCEDIARFLLNDAAAARRFKNIRQNIFAAVKNSKISYPELLRERDSEKDVGRPTAKREQSRPNWQAVFLANTERAKEATRVLEEFAKITDKALAEKFKKIRFAIYEIEKKVIIRHPSISDSKHKQPPGYRNLLPEDTQGAGRRN